MRIAAPIAASVPSSASVCAERTVPSSSAEHDERREGHERERDDGHRGLRLRGHRARDERPAERREGGEVGREQGDDGGTPRSAHGGRARRWCAATQRCASGAERRRADIMRHFVAGLPAQAEL